MDSQDDHPINDCPICCDPINIITDIEITPCMHMFHTTCYKEWQMRSNTCPLCRCALQTDSNSSVFGHFSNVFEEIEPYHRGTIRHRIWSEPNGEQLDRNMVASLLA